MNLLILMKEPSIEKALFTLYVTTATHFLLRKNLKNIMHGLVKLTIFLLDLAPSCIDKYSGTGFGP